MSDLSERKGDHIDLCSSDAVAFKGKTTLFEQVHLMHSALPELSVDEIDLRTDLVGHTTKAPVVIAAMTGGVERAEIINKELASVAEEMGIAFGFGSMRPLLQKNQRKGYFVRDVAPTAVLLGNIGIVQAREASSEQIIEMVSATDVNALCVHMNPAMEVIQTYGDRDFRGGIETLQRLKEDLPIPIIAKETGCGLSESVGHQLQEMGIEWVDISGAGGTSWVGVETLRAKAKTQRIGELYWDWGIPTAASVCQLSNTSLNAIATGGVQNGLDIAKAIALGASAGGLARPFLQAWNAGGRDGAIAAAQQIFDELQFACLLTGSRTPGELRHTPLVIHSPLTDWIPQNSPIWQRLCGTRR